MQNNIDHMHVLYMYSLLSYCMPGPALPLCVNCTYICVCVAYSCFQMDQEQGNLHKATKGESDCHQNCLLSTLCIVHIKQPNHWNVAVCLCHCCYKPFFALKMCDRKRWRQSVSYETWYLGVQLDMKTNNNSHPDAMCHHNPSLLTSEFAFQFSARLKRK